jgi:hypothetical protein
MRLGRIAWTAASFSLLARPASAEEEPEPADAETVIEAESEPDAPLVTKPEVKPARPGRSDETRALRAPPAAPPTGDIVETIDTGESAALPSASGPPPAEDRFELHGWARQMLELGFSNEVFRDDEPDAAALPYDRLISRSQLFLRARYSRARWFEANVSGALSYSTFEQGPARASEPFNGFNGQSTRGELEPRLHELFVGFFGDAIDVRIGQQRLAWGKGEFMSPNDVVNARDLRDPLLSETELRTWPTFLLRADVDLGFASLQGVVAPVYTPDRFDLYGSNWAAVQPDAPVWARGLVNLVRRSFDPSLQEPMQSVLVATEYPNADFSEPVLGARFSWSAGGVDVNYYYQYGFDGPFVSLEPALATGLSSIDYDEAGLVDLGPWLAAIDAGLRPLRARYVRRHHVGTDLSTTLGPFALRLDAAYQSERVFFRRDLMGLASPSVQGVASIEYQTGDPDKLILLEAIYLSLVDLPSAPLMIYARDTVALATNVRWPIWDPVSFELRALVGIQPETSIVQPEVKVKLDALTLSAGGLWLDGEAFSLGEYFERNREIYAKAKYLF